MPSKSNASLALNLVAVVIGMLLLVAASVPLYRLFCSATGYGGTTQEAPGRHAPGASAKAREFTINFNADISPELAWEFKPGEAAVKIKAGAQAMTHFIARNLSDKPVTGHAVYNVTPFSAGPYFVKIQCFCFTEQTLQPHQQVTMPVVFYVDPAVSTDHDMDNVTTITLSYTFFPVKK